MCWDKKSFVIISKQFLKKNYRKKSHCNIQSLTMSVSEVVPMRHRQSFNWFQSNFLHNLYNITETLTGVLFKLSLVYFSIGLIFVRNISRDNATQSALVLHTTGFLQLFCFSIQCLFVDCNDI